MRKSGNAKFCELLEFIVLRVPPVLLVPRCAKHSSFSSPITNRRAKPFIRRGTLHGWKEELRNPNKDRGNVRNLAYLALVENRQNFLNEKLDM